MSSPLNPEQSYAEVLARLRIRLSDATRVGFWPPEASGPAQGVVLSILKEAESARQKAILAASRLREQAAAEEAKAAAFSTVSSMAFAVVDGYVRKAEQAAAAAETLRLSRQVTPHATPVPPPPEAPPSGSDQPTGDVTPYPESTAERPKSSRGGRRGRT